MLNPFITEARFYVLNAIAFSTLKRALVVKGLNIQHLKMFGLKLDTYKYCDPQLQVGENINKITSQAKG